MDIAHPIFTYFISFPSMDPLSVKISIEKLVNRVEFKCDAIHGGCQLSTARDDYPDSREHFPANE